MKTLWYHLIRIVLDNGCSTSAVVHILCDVVEQNMVLYSYTVLHCVILKNVLQQQAACSAVPRA